MGKIHKYKIKNRVKFLSFAIFSRKFVLKLLQVDGVMKYFREVARADSRISPDVHALSVSLKRTHSIFISALPSAFSES